ncbi:putative membrane protein [Bacilli bacterium PM5-3]|nr:putative membrane protein [Bacilli bacterium PM5-3]MDH6603862.1 putative membrane protein [Bacilli bacterium PM5-9]
MNSYYLYVLVIIAIFLQFIISKFQKPILLNIIPAIYTVAILSYAIYSKKLIDNLFLISVLVIFGYGMLWRVGTVFYDSKNEKIKKELEKMKIKDM